eukprot:jgi/Ulvmu1/8561/UM045_0003.1
MTRRSDRDYQLAVNDRVYGTHWYKAIADGAHCGRTADEAMPLPQNSKLKRAMERCSDKPDKHYCLGDDLADRVGDDLADCVGDDLADTVRSCRHYRHSAGCSHRSWDAPQTRPGQLQCPDSAARLSHCKFDVDARSTEVHALRQGQGALACGSSCQLRNREASALAPSGDHATQPLPPLTTERLASQQEQRALTELLRCHVSAITARHPDVLCRLPPSINSDTDNQLLQTLECHHAPQHKDRAEPRRTTVVETKSAEESEVASCDNVSSGNVAEASGALATVPSDTAAHLGDATEAACPGTICRTPVSRASPVAIQHQHVDLEKELLQFVNMM